MKKSQLMTSSVNLQLSASPPPQIKQKQKGYNSIALQEKYGIQAKIQQKYSNNYLNQDSDLTRQMWQLCTMGGSQSKTKQLFSNYFFHPKTTKKSQHKNKQCQQPQSIQVNTQLINTLEPITHTMSENLILASTEVSDLEDSLNLDLL
ncbi:hypothetical protein SS50377_28007 [Spironucleus salmonicida]|uniref:Uncharacterized protein n=1 Tax=Spironucleus salmonicida TaxID=348837 RepID=A0A9P8LKX1_9EUKA|nr:hypothetical protein SS50377_28007 [Spironucleus salmonicida]